jgi:aminocarboxymuconate-semialdehyde decarboxylase
VHVLSPVPITLVTWAEPGLAAQFARAQNDALAAVAASAPDRFRWFGSVPLQDVELAVAELERSTRELGMAGVEIGTEVGGLELDDPSLRPFFAAAAALGIPVFVHPTDSAHAIRRTGAPYEFGLGMLTDTAMAAGALVFGGVLAELPTLRVGLAHGCGSFPWAYPRLARGATLGNGSAEVSDHDAEVRRLWVDALVFDPLHLPLLFERFGADHVLLGSDFPFYPPAWGGPLDVLDQATAAGLCTPAQATAIRASNAVAFLAPTNPRSTNP